MSVQQDLLDLGDLFNFSDLSTFTQNIPVEWVVSALDLSAQASIRRRRLPTDQVLWLVLGMALFRDEPVHEVARRLNICAQGLATDHLLARSGVTQARAIQAAVAFGREPSDIRFKPACQYIAVQLIVMAAANPISATGRRLAELRRVWEGCFWITVRGLRGQGR